MSDRFTTLCSDSKKNGTLINAPDFEESEGQRVLSMFRSLGYSPRPGHHDVIEFVKDYADAGERVRVRIYFDKPVMGMAGARFSNIVVAAQRSLPPTQEAVLEAPVCCRRDLEAIVSAFAGRASLPDQAIAERSCISCGEVASDYWIVNDDAVCLRCVKRRRG